MTRSWPLLADALLASGGHAGADEWAAQWIRQRERIDAKRNRFFPSVLHTVEKLAYGFPPAASPRATCPRAARRCASGRSGSSTPAILAGGRQAYALASLIHVGEVDFCQDAAAAIAAAVAAGMRPGTGVPTPVTRRSPPSRRQRRADA